MRSKRILLSALCAIGAALAASSLRAENKIPEECSIGGFFIGCQAYTFNQLYGV